MANDWLATAWAKIFRTDLAAEIRKRNDQPQPKTPDTDSEETLKPGSSTESDDAAVTDDSETDNPRAPDTASHGDNDSHDDSSDDDNSAGAADNIPKEAHDQNESSMANQSSHPIGGVGGFIGIFHKVSSYVVTKVKHAVLDASDSIKAAVEKVKELGISGVAKNIKNWIQENPWKTALVGVPLVTLACTAIALSAVGFGPGGIAAGSTAAIIQAGIGNVVAGSLFATCTSAMMGGYGALIIFGGIWTVTTLAVASCAAIWKSWHSRKDRRLVRLPTTLSRTTLDAVEEAAHKTIFGIMLAAAYVTYRVKSWQNGRGGPGSPSERPKRE